MASRSGQLASIFYSLAHRTTSTNDEDYCGTEESNWKINSDIDRITIGINTSELNVHEKDITKNESYAESPASGDFVDSSLHELHQNKNSRFILAPSISENPESNYVLTLARTCAAVAWLIFILNICFFIYGIFFYSVFSTNQYPIGTAPIGTYIFPETMSCLIPAKLAYMISVVFLQASWFFAPTMLFFISICLQKEFLKVNLQFKKAVAPVNQDTCEVGGKFTGNIEIFRIRHQKIVRLVDQADKFLCFCISANVIGHAALASLMLYILIWFPQLRGS